MRPADNRDQQECPDVVGKLVSLGMAAARNAPVSIRSQLVGLVLVIVVPVLGVIAWLLAEVSQQARRSAGAEVRLIAVSMAASLAAVVREHDALLERIQERPLVKALDPRRCDTLLGEYVAMRLELANVEVFDRRGERVCSALSGPLAEPRDAAAPWFREALARDEFRVGDAWFDAPSKRWLVPLSKPVHDASDAVAGLVVATVDLLALQRLVLDALPPGAELEVLDREGRVLMRSADEGGIGKLMRAPFVAAARADTGGDFAAAGVDDRPWLYAPVTMPISGWQLVAGRPEADLLAAQHALWWRAAAVIAAVLLLKLLLVWHVAARIVAPVHALAATSRRIAAGDDAARALPDGPSEVRELALHFNRMLEVRQRNEQALRVSQDRLRSALDASSRSFWDFDLSSGTVYLSESWSLQLGGPFEATYTSFEALAARVPEDEHAALRVALAAALKDPHAGYRVEHRVRRDDGGWFWNLSEGRVVERGADGRALRMVGTNRDITERRQGQALLLGQKQVLQMIAAGAPLADILGALALVIEAQTTGGVCCAVMLLDIDGVHLRHGAAPSLPPEFTQALDGLQIGDDTGACGAAAFRGEAVIAEDIASDPLWAELREPALRHGLRACWSTPILDARRRVLGTFALYWQQPGRPGAQHQWLLDVATQTAALAIDHHAAQDEQRQSMLVLENTLEHMDQGISIADRELRVLGTNRRFRELLDLPASLCYPQVPAEVIFRYNARRGDYGPGDIEEQVRSRVELARRREPHRFERERPDGTILEVRGTPLPDGGFVTTYTDVTQRARSERELLRFRAALDLSSDGVYLIGVESLAVVDCNDGACRALGYRREELVGIAGERIIADRTREQVRAAYAKLLAGDASNSNFEALHRRKDGSVFPVEVNRRLHHTADGPVVVAVARDMTARKQAEAALRDSEETLRAVVAEAPDAVVRIDSAGRVAGWNAQAERSFGWSAAEAIGRMLAELIVPPRYRDAHERGMRHFLATGEGPVLNRRIELVALRRDGGEFPVELGITPIRTRDGHEFSGFIRDLSATRQAEAERSALEAQLRESQKMEAIGTLAGGIAHDFNNILGAILGNVALARDDVGADHPALVSLQQVHKAGLRARALVQQILAFSRRQPQQLVGRALRPLVEESLALLRATLPAGVALETRLADEPLHALADATQMQQVLLNLCTNAWHALPGGSGRIVVGLEPLLLDAAAAQPVSGLASSRYAHVWVSDDGSGMDEATRARIFEPFFTTKPVGQGTGLGLSVVHGIVAAHSGTIHVDSDVGRGSTFHLYFPLVEAGAVETHSGFAALQPAQGTGEHVLYIDDDEVMVLLAERLLQRSGYRVTCCGDPRQALAALAAQPHGFDVVVSDFNMPAMSGLDLAREIARIRPGLPVIIGSGLITDAMRVDAIAAGVRHLMHKENAFAELAPLVQLALAEAGG